jgi:hypothetical protein
MKNLSCALALFLVGTTLLTGCSMLTTSGRQQRAYARYVEKSSLGRVKQQKRMGYRKVTMPVMQPTEPTITAEASGPQSVSSGDGGGQ